MPSCVVNDFNEMPECCCYSVEVNCSY